MGNHEFIQINLLINFNQLKHYWMIWKFINYLKIYLLSKKLWVKKYLKLIIECKLANENFFVQLWNKERNEIW